VLLERPKKMLNKARKRAQVSDTVTWIVATIIIIAILLIFLYISSVLSGENAVEKKSSSVFSGGNSAEVVDWIALKTSIAYNLNDKNKEVIDKWIGENG
jgi:hypothetical protein